MFLFLHFIRMTSTILKPSRPNSDINAPIFMCHETHFDWRNFSAAACALCLLHATYIVTSLMQKGISFKVVFVITSSISYFWLRWGFEQRPLCDGANHGFIQKRKSTLNYYKQSTQNILHGWDADLEGWGTEGPNQLLLEKFPNFNNIYHSLTTKAVILWRNMWPFSSR